MKQPKPRSPNVPRTGVRRLVIGTATWRWSMHGGSVSVWSPDGKRRNVDPHTILGVSPNTWERGQWKRTQDGVVSPRHVRAFIEGLP